MLSDTGLSVTDMIANVDMWEGPWFMDQPSEFFRPVEFCQGSLQEMRQSSYLCLTSVRWRFCSVWGWRGETVHVFLVIQHMTIWAHWLSMCVVLLTLCSSWGRLPAGAILISAWLHGSEWINILANEINESQNAWWTLKCINRLKCYFFSCQGKRPVCMMQ